MNSVRRLPILLALVGVWIDGTGWSESKPDQFLTLPLSVRVMPNKAEPLVSGLYAPGLKVVIRNTTPLAGEQGVAMPLQAFVLRGVYWDDYSGDLNRWLRRQYGSTREESSGNIMHNQMSQQLTHLAFESGLLLPGEKREVVVPLTPQREGKHTLVVEYAVVGNGRDWMGEVLLPVRSSPMATTYVPASPVLVSKRKGIATGLALTLSTCKPDAAILPVLTKQFELALPLAEDERYQKTGGISYVEASWRAGLTPLPDDCKAFFRPFLQSWILVKSDGAAVALVKEKNPNPKIPPTAPPGTKPKQYVWKSRPLPAMDSSVPDYFGEAGENGVDLLLSPDTFGDLVKVSTPSMGMYYNPGATRITTQQLWGVLDRARDRGIPLKVVTIDPNGLGNVRLVSVGVAVDESGRWSDPKVDVKVSR